MLSPALVVLAAACALLGGAVALAGPAAAIEDPRRPTAEVTHGPSCGPGVVRVEVTNGTEAHHVALVLDGGPELDGADLGPAGQAELTSSDVDWGQTVDVAVTVTDLDGTREAALELGTYTRPSAEDCGAISTPTTGTGAHTPTPGATSAVPTPPVPSSSVPSSSVPSSSVPSSPAPSSPSTRPPTPSGTTPAPGTPQSTPPASSSSSPAASGPAAPSAASVSPGGVVRLRATGFTPGELVTVTLLGAHEPLTTVTAEADGSVEAVVQIPRDLSLGAATVRLVGGASAASAGLDLQVAARQQPLAPHTTSVPVLAAGTGLIGAAAVLGLTAARRSRGTTSRAPR